MCKYTKVQNTLFYRLIEHNNLKLFKRRHEYEKIAVLLAGVAAASTSFLAACTHLLNASERDWATYNYVYGGTNHLTSNRSTTSDITTNLVDGLFETTNTVIPFAEDWSVSQRWSSGLIPQAFRKRREVV